MKKCPCCQDILLRCIYRSEMTWFCPSCRQQMPSLDSILQSNQIRKKQNTVIK
ncbi:hypothetical protein Sta7437_3927 [Stanieria cyanosphaera PCC 7437]|uniref:Uncharacterized protein n=1 Tax=Stanieria cyanosphaera (strain ATCC 29371 / PCC 7437) TaxID=111780 RepID=K9XZE4_STAC7|nr:hypothetical protein Sta7437_3927 [Stanieria cyanosphaera PCC 7437]